jgi:hypothetical protein
MQNKKATGCLKNAILPLRHGHEGNKNLRIKLCAFEPL